MRTVHHRENERISPFVRNIPSYIGEIGGVEGGNVTEYQEITVNNSVKPALKQA